MGAPARPAVRRPCSAQGRNHHHPSSPTPPPFLLSPAAQVTGLAVSGRHPYMFSCGLDKTVKCWDLEQNKVRRSGSRAAGWAAGCCGGCCGGCSSDGPCCGCGSGAQQLQAPGTAGRLAPPQSSCLRSRASPCPCPSPPAPPPCLPPGHPQLPRPPVGRVLAGAAPHPGRAADRRPRQRVPRVGHAQQGAGALPERPRQHRLLHHHRAHGPAGEEGGGGQVWRRAAWLRGGGSSRGQCCSAGYAGGRRWLCATTAAGRWRGAGRELAGRWLGGGRQEGGGRRGSGSTRW
jgi:hypothetical protein